jgi:hypothetical protein
VSLFAREGRIAIDDCVQVACKDVLDKSRNLDVLRLDVWQLDPVLQGVVRDPVHPAVHSFSPLFRVVVLLFFFLRVELAFHNPVVFLSPVELAEKEGLFFSEVDSGPFEHPGLLVDIGDDESLVLAEQVFIVLWQHIDDLYSITPR